MRVTTYFWSESRRVRANHHLECFVCRGSRSGLVADPPSFPESPLIYDTTFVITVLQALSRVLLFKKANRPVLLAGPDCFPCFFIRIFCKLYALQFYCRVLEHNPSKWTSPPPTLDGTYSQYKQDTEFIKDWLISTARSLQCPETLLPPTAPIIQPEPGGRRKGKARVQPVKRGASSTLAVSNRHSLPTRFPTQGYIALAE